MSCMFGMVLLREKKVHKAKENKSKEKRRKKKTSTHTTTNETCAEEGNNQTNEEAAGGCPVAFLSRTGRRFFINCCGIH